MRLLNPRNRRDDFIFMRIEYHNSVIAQMCEKQVMVFNVQAGVIPACGMARKRHLVECTERQSWELGLCLTE
jgi:hypothetical protein